MRYTGLTVLVLMAATAAGAEEVAAADVAVPPANDAQALAKKLANPIASLISLPFQTNFDGKIGPTQEGSKITTNIQPVVPISLTPDINLISRTIVPVVWQEDIVHGAGTQFGLGDTVQSAFLSPAQPKGIIWGAGPVFLVPTGTDAKLSGGKWAAGPTAVALKQSGPWTVGALANHIWSFAGNSARSDISATFVNPFLNYTTKKATTYSLAADITYDWKNDRWTVPVTATIAQLTRVGGQLVSIGGGLRYYIASNDNAPHGLAGRFTVTLLFPKK
jgi:hypothetical protein